MVLLKAYLVITIAKVVLFQAAGRKWDPSLSSYIRYASVTPWSCFLPLSEGSLLPGSEGCLAMLPSSLADDPLPERGNRSGVVCP